MLWTEAAELKAEVLRMEQEFEGLECSEEDDVEDPPPRCYSNGL